VSTTTHSARSGEEVVAARETYDGNGAPPARIFLQPIAAPSILGLFGFATATMMVAGHVAGWYGSVTTPLYLFPFAAMFGGLAQFLAGMWSYKARDAVATGAHGTWGAFWLAYGILYAFVAAGKITLPLPGASFPELGFWFVMLGAVTASLALAALGENLGIFAVLSTLAAGSIIYAIGLFIGSSGWDKVGGWVLAVSAGIAWYAATAMVLEASWGRTILPTGKLRKAANVPLGRPSRPVQYEFGDPGVRRGQ
jgi:succinate-acetate transporter protein